MPSRQRIAKELADILRIVAHPDRIRLVEELRDSECDVTSLAQSLDLTGSRVSQHLSLLRARRLVEERRDGRRHLYRLSQPELAGWILDGLEFLEGAIKAVPPDTIDDARRRWRGAQPSEKSDNTRGSNPGRAKSRARA